MRQIPAVMVAAAAFLAWGCCGRAASSAEAKKICTDPELLELVKVTDLAQRRAKVLAWGEANVTSVEAKQKVELLATGQSLSRADRDRMLDDFAKEHGLPRCEVAHVKVP